MGRTPARKPQRIHALMPPATMSKEATKVFVALVDSVDPAHFEISDLPLLVSYSDAIANADKAQQQLDKEGQVTAAGKASPWLVPLEKAQRSIVALSMRLRLAPQSRFDRLRAGSTVRPQNSFNPALYSAVDDDDLPPLPDKLTYFRLSTEMKRRYDEKERRLRAKHGDDDPDGYFA
jgi:phage terminase small subunit